MEDKKGNLPNRWDKTERITKIQKVAELLGWNRDLASKVKISDVEIAPNGTRRERRINNNFTPSEEDSEGNFYIERINFDLKRAK